jgi:hypothetical protein
MKFVQAGSVNHSGTTAISVVQPHNCVKSFLGTRERELKNATNEPSMLLKTNVVCFGDPTM